VGITPSRIRIKTTINIIPNDIFIAPRLARIASVDPSRGFDSGVQGVLSLAAVQMAGSFETGRGSLYRLVHFVPDFFHTARHVFPGVLAALAQLLERLVRRRPPTFCWYASLVAMTTSLRLTTLHSHHMTLRWHAVDMHQLRAKKRFCQSPW
jgi:hypothetical protein